MCYHSLKVASLLLILTFAITHNVGSNASGEPSPEEKGFRHLLSEVNSHSQFIKGNIPTASIDDVTVTEGQDAVFTVSLDFPATSTVSLSFSTFMDTADDPDDFLGVPSGQLTIRSGSETMTITIATVDDNEGGEGDERFNIALTSATGAFIGDGFGVGTIQDNDGPIDSCPQPYPDFNMDEGVDAIDLSRLVQGIRADDAAFDLTGDNQTTGMDVIKFSLSWYAADCGE